MKSAAVCVGIMLMTAGTGGGQTTNRRLDDLARRFADAFNAKDAARVAAFYTDDAAVMAPDQPMIKGRRNIEAYYASGFRQNIENFRLFPIESATAGNQAFEAGHSMLSGRPAAGADLITKNGKYVVIYRRVGSEWKIAYDIFNDD
jgi:ketosteroid isomerase-like protein